MIYFLVAVGSALGGVLRYALTRHTRLEQHVPLGHGAHQRGRRVCYRLLRYFYFVERPLRGQRACPSICHGGDMRRVYNLLVLQPADLRPGTIRRLGKGTPQRPSVGCSLFFGRRRGTSSRASLCYARCHCRDEGGGADGLNVDPPKQYC